MGEYKLFKKEIVPEIKFVTEIPGLADIDSIKPKLASSYIPEWFKEMKNFDGSVKQCPSFPEYFTQGVILPAWTDMKLFYNSVDQSWNWETPNQIFQIDSHPNNQLIDHVDTSVLGKKGHFVFKLLCPWNIITPKGYSVYQLPVTYEFHKDFSVLPGIIRTDIHHQINQQLLIHTSDKEIFIKRGTPLAHYIPFKRKKLNYIFRSSTPEDSTSLNTAVLDHHTQFKFTGSYLRRKRELS
jgi:hypothetical protein